MSRLGMINGCPKEKIIERIACAGITKHMASSLLNQGSVQNALPKGFAKKAQRLTKAPRRKK